MNLCFQHGTADFEIILDIQVKCLVIIVETMDILCMCVHF